MCSYVEDFGPKYRGKTLNGFGIHCVLFKHYISIVRCFYPKHTYLKRYLVILQPFLDVLIVITEVTEQRLLLMRDNLAQKENTRLVLTRLSNYNNVFCFLCKWACSFQIKKVYSFSPWHDQSSMWEHRGPEARCGGLQRNTLKTWRVQMDTFNQKEESCMRKKRVRERKGDHWRWLQRSEHQYEANRGGRST